MGSWGPALDSARLVTGLLPSDPDAWARVGRISLRRNSLEDAVEAFERARLEGAEAEVLLDLALARQLQDDVGGEVSACEEATKVDPDWPTAWSRYAHALARTERRSDCRTACEKALSFGPDPEVSALLRWLEESEPKALKSAAG
jgi:cytochrome c-type biogenesis protein CcmH/NrfG